MAEHAGTDRGRHVLTTLLVVVVIGLAAVLAGLKYGRGKGKGLEPAPPAKNGGDAQAPAAQPKEDARVLRERIRRHCQDARAAMQDGDTSAAYECWREAHELAPDDSDIATEFERARAERDFDILFDQGEAAYLMDDLGQALVYYEKAQQLKPRVEKVDEKVRFCRYAIPLREAQEAEKKADWKTAEEKFTEALKHNPESSVAKTGLANAKQQIAGLPVPPDQTQNPLPGAEVQARLRSLQDRINALQKENMIESFQEATKLCDELEKLVAASPDVVTAVRNQKKLIAEKQSGYEKLYATKLALAQAALAGDPATQRPSEPGMAIKMAEDLRAMKYRKDTTEVDALIMECRRRSVMSDMVLVTEGMYEVGADDGPSPRRQVIVGNFFLDRREVTNQQYKAYVDAAGSRWPKNWTDGRFPPGLEHYPVMGVSYAEAESFCKWAGKRLPTEEEWEVAASGGQPQRYPWGEEFIEGYAVTKEKGVTGPTMVGAHPDGKSAYGVLDMIGNVAEWTSSTTPDTQDPERTVHIAKGGCFFHGVASCAIASRFTDVTGTLQLVGYGFRCVIDASPEAIERYNKEHSAAGTDETSSK